MHRARGITCLALFTCLTLGMVSTPFAQDEAGEEDGPKLGWGNVTDLSLVLTDGNARAETLGFDNRLTRRWQKSFFELKLNAVRSDTPDDNFRQVESGVAWPVGDPPPTGGTSTLIVPPLEEDVEKYWIEPSFSRNISKNLFWTLGTSWNRDVDAGIINRYVGYATVGNNWVEKENLEWRTSYGASYTDREEDVPDPTKDQTFPGARLSWYFMTMFGKNKTMTYENDWDFTMNLKSSSDFSTNMIQSFAVKMTTHLSLKISLQWQYNNEPALEDIDLVAQVVVVDCDPLEFPLDDLCFETVDSGGAELVLGDVGERKKQLDTIFRTSLSIKF